MKKLENLEDQQGQYSRRNCLLVHGFAVEKKEITDAVITNTINEKLDLEKTLQDIEKMHQIGKSKKTTGKTHPIIVKFVQYNKRNRVFRNKKKLKGQKKSITESLKNTRMDKLKKLKKPIGLPMFG